MHVQTNLRNLSGVREGEDIQKSFGRRRERVENWSFSRQVPGDAGYHKQQRSTRQRDKHSSIDFRLFNLILVS